VYCTRLGSDRPFLHTADPLRCHGAHTRPLLPPETNRRANGSRKMGRRNGSEKMGGSEHFGGPAHIVSSENRCVRSMCVNHSLQPCQCNGMEYFTRQYCASDTQVFGPASLRLLFGLSLFQHFSRQYPCKSATMIHSEGIASLRGLTNFVNRARVRKTPRARTVDDDGTFTHLKTFDNMRVNSGCITCLTRLRGSPGIDACMLWLIG
jgi:hypothetical protein